MKNINLTNDNSNLSSEMNLGFAYINTQSIDSFRNFLKKIEVDDVNEKLTLTFTKFAKNPIVIDFKNKIITLPSNAKQPFKKFLLMTYEFIQDKKAVALKTFRFDNNKLFKGIRYFGMDDMKNVKLTNFLDIYEYNYEKSSVKLMVNDQKYIYPIPDFYKCSLLAS